MLLQEAIRGPGAAAGRRMHTAGPHVTVATTAQQLQAAVAAGAPHIEIRQHLDLTTLPILESDGDRPIDDNDAILGAVPPSVKSIRARCNTAPAAGSFGLDEHVPLLPLLNGQCLLVTDGDVMQVTDDLWIDGLYVRMRHTVRFPTPQLLLVRGPSSSPGGGGGGGRRQGNSTAAGAGSSSGPDSGGAEAQRGGVLWMSFCTVQGEQRGSGSGGITGLQAFGNVHTQDCTFANLGGSVDALEVRAPGAAAFCHTSFRDNRIASAEAAVVAARGADARLQGCTFSGNSGDGHLLLLGAPSTQHAGAGAAVYSDEPREVCLEAALQSCARTGHVPGCVDAVASPVQTLPASQWPPADPVLSLEDPWFQGTRKDLEPIYRQSLGGSQPQPNSMGNCSPEGPPRSASGLGGRATVIGIACVAAAALISLLAAAAFFFLRRRRRIPQRALHEQGKQSMQASTVLHVHL